MIERRFHKFGQRRCSPASVVSSSSSKIYSVDLGCRRCCCCNENGIYLVAINILPLQRCDVTLGLAWSMITSIIRAYKLYQKKRENFVRNLSAIFNTNGARSKNCIFIRNAYRKRFPPIPIEISETENLQTWRSAFRRSKRRDTIHFGAVWKTVTCLAGKIGFF